TKPTVAHFLGSVRIGHQLCVSTPSRYRGHTERYARTAGSQHGESTYGVSTAGREPVHVMNAGTWASQRVGCAGSRPAQSEKNSSNMRCNMSPQAGTCSHI